MNGSARYLEVARQCFEAVPRTPGGGTDVQSIPIEPQLPRQSKTRRTEAVVVSSLDYCREALAVRLAGVGVASREPALSLETGLLSLVE